MSNLMLEPKVEKKQGIMKSVLISIPILLLSLVLLSGGKVPENNLKKISFAAVYIFINILFFLIIYKGKTYKYRKILFVTYAFLFIISFMTNLIEARGSIVLKGSDMLAGETPFCHIVITMVIIPAVLTKTIIFPGSLLKGFASIGSMIVIWIGATIALGRAWCSWVCFYGGLDEGFSSLCRKPKIKIYKKWTYLPIAVLIAIVLLSAASLSPIYCQWLCPFKAVTEYPEINSMTTFLQAIIFYSLFAILVVILPILTGKRTQCALFCPFGAMQSFMNKINIFEIRIDKEKCLNCKKCIRECPTYSIDEKSIVKGRTLITCTKCGKCVDVCTAGAVSYHIKGTPVGIRSDRARLLFIYSAYLFALTMGGGAIMQGIYRILKLATTGSLF